MSILKDFPILEFDPDKDSHINPKMITKKYPGLPKYLVVCFFKEVISFLLKNHEIVLHTTLRGENEVNIYQFKNRDVALVEGKVGAPMCAGVLEECIALGSRYVMFCGGGGVLRKDLTVGHLIVIDSAIRDEGTSYHYVEPSREIKANPKVVSLIENHLKENNIDHIIGKSWTTDAFYRETKAKIELRKNEGALIVEMEQSAMIAVSQFREILYGAIIYGGDDLSQDVWDNRGWTKREDIRLALTRLCVDLVLMFNQI